MTCSSTQTYEAPIILGAFGCLESSAIVVHQERCAKMRNRNVSCLRCAEACTSGCISIQDDRLVVDASKCVGCGTCATVCPTCALEARNPNDEFLFAECKKALVAGKVVIACNLALQAAGDYVEASNIVPVVCAGRVEESLLVRLVAAGAQEVHIVCGVCEKCAQKHGKACAQTIVSSAQALLSAWGNNAKISIDQEFSSFVMNVPDADGKQAACAAKDACAHAMESFFECGRGNEPVARPEAGASAAADVAGYAAEDTAPAAAAAEDTALAAGDAVTAAVPADAAAVGFAHAVSAAYAPEEPQAAFRLPHVMDDGTLPHFLPDRRERLLEGLSRLGNPVEERVPSRLWGWVVIDGTKCVSCRMCATFCPTGAISKFDEEEGRFGVRHFPADCVKCRSCQDICPANAIMVFDGVRPASLLEGEVHTYVMKERPTSIGNAHQILSHMRHQMAGNDIFER